MSSRIVSVLFALLTALLASAAASLRATATASLEPRPVVLVAPVEGMVDLGLAPFLDRVLDEAERDGAAAVILDIDTLGGRLDAAITIRDRLLESQVQTVAFVHPRAISAGALIALAANGIATSGGATLGAATPVRMQPGAAATQVDEKAVSYVRNEFRATAEHRGRPAALAEAMVDPDADVAGLAPAGKLLTLTGAQALELGVADLRADDLPALLRGLDLGEAEVRMRAPNWAERAASAITAPLVSAVLMTLGMIGVLLEIRTPGFGIPGVIGIVCLGLFFGGHWIVRLAGFEELGLIGLGVALLAVEVFVTPGFGLAGVLGIAALVAGLGLSLIGAGATAGALVASLGRVAVSLIVAVTAVLALLAIVPHVPFARGIVLTAGAHEAARVGVEAPRPQVGATGTALTPLRPSGTATLAGVRVDVVTEGEFVPAGAKVEVLHQEGHRVVVRLADPLQHEGGAAKA